MYADESITGSTLMDAMMAAGFTVTPKSAKPANLNELSERDRIFAKLILKARRPEQALGIRIKSSELQEPAKVSAILHRVGATLYGIKSKKEFLTIGRAKFRKTA